jgi:hypothetical protein
MKLVVEGQAYEFDQGRLTVKEARLIKGATGFTVNAWQQALGELDADAVAALVWLLRRRNGELGLAFDDVDFDLSSLTVEDDGPESPTSGQPAPVNSGTV